MDEMNEFDKMQMFAFIWFAFVAILSLALLGGGVFVVIKVLQYFGIL